MSEQFEEYDYSKEQLAPCCADGFRYDTLPQYEQRSPLTLLPPLYQRMTPRSFQLKVETNRTYRVEVTITAQSDLPAVYLFSGRRQLRDVRSLRAGESYRFVFYQSLTDCKPDFSEVKYQVDHLFCTICCTTPDQLSVSLRAQAASVPVVFLCGDSTVTDQESPVPYQAPITYSSWGQVLPYFLSGPIAVNNQAHSGNTTASFRSEGHFDIITKNMHPGDYCLFQFGHNDQKQAQLLPKRGYRANLLRFISEIRSLGGIPILVTPMGRNIWNQDGSYLDLLLDYAKEVHLIGKQESVPVIDLHRDSIAFLKSVGFDQAKDYFGISDYTHTNEFGAYQMACVIAQGLHKIDTNLFSIRAQTLDFEPLHDSWNLFSPTKRASQQNGNASGDLHVMEHSLKSLIETIKRVKNES